jgi:hypothetical protein
MLTNFLFTLALVSQLGASSSGDILSGWELGQSKIPNGFRVIPQELVINVDKAGTYKFEVEIDNFTNQDVNFDVIYCPDNIKLSGLRSRSLGDKDKAKFTATMEVSEEDWKSLVTEAKASNQEAQMGSEAHVKRNPDQADAITKIGAIIRDSKGNEIGAMDIPVFIRHITEPSKQNEGSRFNTNSNPDAGY